VLAGEMLAGVAGYSHAAGKKLLLNELLFLLIDIVLAGCIACWQNHSFVGSVLQQP